jgi:YidC/Oxa1 family membrane protein insertase
MLDGIIDVLLWIMDKTHFVTRTWAIDIILLTILVRLAMYPLNLRMNKSMKLMQKLQPEMKAIQEKYRDKADVAQKELMELYRKYKVNPLSSCWPMLVQMPIFIALFWALRDSRFYLRLAGFENATFFGISLTTPPLLSHPYPEEALRAGVFDLYSLVQWSVVADRFLYLPTLWLVAIYIATTVIQSRQMQAQSQAAASGQPNTMAFMLPMFIIIGMLFPTGLLIYFITSNVLQMGTYWRIQREIALEEGTREEASPKADASPESSNKTTSPGRGSGRKAPNKGAPSAGRKKKKR